MRVKPFNVFQEIAQILLSIEVLGDEWSIDRKRRIGIGSNLMINVFLCLLMKDKCFCAVAVKVDVEVIVVVIAIETPEKYKAATYESAWVPATSFRRCFSLDCHNFSSAWIDGEEILQIFTSPSSENIDQSIVIMRKLPPSCRYFTLETDFLPSQVIKIVCFFEASQAQLEQIPKTVVLSFTSSEYENPIVIFTRRMEPSCPRPHVALHFDLSPS